MLSSRLCASRSFFVGLAVKVGCKMGNAHIIVSVSYEDDLGVPASTPLYGLLDDGTTIATMLTDVGAIIADIKAVSTAKIVGVSVGVEATVSDTLGDDPECERGLNLSFETDTTRDWGIWFASLDPALVVDGKVVTASGAVKTLSDALVAGSGTITWESAYRNGLTALETAAESFRKLRRNAEKLTKVIEA